MGIKSQLTVLEYSGALSPQSPVHVMDPEVQDEEELAGSYSPQLLQDDDENEDAIDPEEDKAILVIGP